MHFCRQSVMGARYNLQKLRPLSVIGYYTANHLHWASLRNKQAPRQARVHASQRVHRRACLVLARQRVGFRGDPARTVQHKAPPPPPIHLQQLCKLLLQCKAACCFHTQQTAATARLPLTSKQSKARRWRLGSCMANCSYAPLSPPRSAELCLSLPRLARPRAVCARTSSWACRQPLSFQVCGRPRQSCTGRIRARTRLMLAPYEEQQEQKSQSSV